MGQEEGGGEGDLNALVDGGAVKEVGATRERKIF